MKNFCCVFFALLISVPAFAEISATSVPSKSAGDSLSSTEFNTVRERVDELITESNTWDGVEGIPINESGTPSAADSSDIGALFTGGNDYLKADGTTGTGGGDVSSSSFTQDGGILVGTGNGAFQEEEGSTARTSLGLGTAATRAAEDSLTDGANLPDGAAVIAWYDAYIQSSRTVAFDLADGASRVVEWMDVTAGETIANGQQVYIKKDAGNSDTRAYLYNADTADTDNDTYAIIGIATEDETAGDTLTIRIAHSIQMRRDEITWDSDDIGKMVVVGSSNGGQGLLPDGDQEDAGDHNEAIGIFIGANGFDSVTGDYVIYTVPNYTAVIPSSVETVPDTIAVVLNGGGSALLDGAIVCTEVSFDATITEARLLADQSGSVKVDWWKDTYANYPPTSADTITASATPEISSDTQDTDSTLSGWTTSITAEDVLCATIEGNATAIEQVTAILKVAR
jgi:hypothetical protein